MILLKPMGTKLIVLPVQTDNFVTDSNIEIVNLGLETAEVMEVSDEQAEIYSVGDKVVYHKGAGFSIPYKKQQCVVLDGRGAPAGDILFIVTNE